MSRSTKQIEFGRDFADEVAGLVVGLESGSPHLAATLVGKVRKILDEAGEKIALCEQGVDRKIDLQAIVQFQAAAPGSRSRGR